jgi:hypothetical protein
VMFIIQWIVTVPFSHIIIALCESFFADC